MIHLCFYCAQDYFQIQKDAIKTPHLHCSVNHAVISLKQIHLTFDPYEWRVKFFIALLLNAFSSIYTLHGIALIVLTALL